MFNIEMFPAAHGDCLWIEYGDSNAPHRVLIDGGTGPTYKKIRERIDSLPEDDRRFDLFVITHVDADHIEGSVRLLGDENTGVKFDDVWFNGWRHLPAPEVDDRLGPVQGEFLTALIQKHRLPWNTAFKQKAVVVPEGGSLPEVTLAGGMKVTLLSPTARQLIRLRPQWNKVVREAGLEPGVAKEALAALAKNKRLQPDALGGPTIKVDALAKSAFDADSAVANGSSIAFLAEFDGKRALLTGDAFAPVLAGSIQRLLDARELDRLAIHAFKLPHHGSKSNISTDLLDMVRCKKYLFSTNGNIFNHPDPEGVARVIVHGGKGCSLLFNYKTEDNDMWAEKKLAAKYEYSTVYPKEGDQGLIVKL